MPLTSSSTFSASVTSAATATFMVEFKVSRTVGILPSTVYLVGLAFGPMFLAPLSEFIGRRWLYTCSSAALIAFSAGAGASHTLAGVLVCRFLAGFFGTCGIAIGAGTIYDVWGHGPARGLAALLFTCGPFFGPSMGPMAGAYVMNEHAGNWRWTQWVICLVGAPIFVLILFMKETAPSTVQHAAGEGAKRPLPLVILLTLKAAVVRSLTMLGTEAISFWLTLYTGYAYAVVFSFFASGNYVYTTDYGFDNRQVGLVFLAVVIGYVLAAVLHIIVDKTLYARAERLSPTGRAAPEHRLYSGMAGSVFLPIGLFWYAWASKPGGHWASLAASGIPFGLGAFVLFVRSPVYAVAVKKCRSMLTFAVVIHHLPCRVLRRRCCRVGWVYCCPGSCPENPPLTIQPSLPMVASATSSVPSSRSLHSKCTRILASTGPAASSRSCRWPCCPSRGSSSSTATSCAPQVGSPR